MILTDIYKGEKAPDKKTRYEVVASTGNYDLFESILINKRNPNKGGQSFNFVDTPDNWNFGPQKRRPDKAISKGSFNISSVFVPDVKKLAGYGDINTTLDGCLILFNSDYSEIEIFISRGQRNNKMQLYQLYLDGELDEEIEKLRKEVTLC